MSTRIFLMATLLCASGLAVGANAPEPPEPATNAAELAGQIEQIRSALGLEQEALRACHSMGRAFLLGSEAKRAGEGADATRRVALRLSASEAEVREMEFAARIGYEAGVGANAGRAAQQMRDTCLRSVGAKSPVVSGAHAVAQAATAADARLRCAATVGGDFRPMSSAELQYLGCLPASAYPGLPDSLGGGELVTEVRRRDDGGLTLSVEGAMSGVLAEAACVTLNTTPPVRSEYQVRCRMTGGAWLLKLERQYAGELVDPQATLDEATAQLLEIYMEQQAQSPLPAQLPGATGAGVPQVKSGVAVPSM